ncbi:hypothetical protein Jab_2c28190 [Janthinobacterium sp. HH01]|uniref:hypothetical protein n=1 Tax=Janthinobacterium sp. HH01 TaxID=1198452 RepID=UPI0002AE8C08|nr:hypothetical protein [Janthinobacterium sp. HH01]ELX10719.1 hypothetical protein Jab_2c28190 [Janthinobacterium sp. HH01]
MDKDTLKGLAILIGVALAVAIFAVLGTENGVQKLYCMGRAVLHGVSITNIHSVCGL